MNILRLDKEEGLKYKFAERLKISLFSYPSI